MIITKSEVLCAALDIAWGIHRSAIKQHGTR